MLFCSSNHVAVLLCAVFFLLKSVFELFISKKLELEFLIVLMGNIFFSNRHKLSDRIGKRYCNESWGVFFSPIQSESNKRGMYSVSFRLRQSFAAGLLWLGLGTCVLNSRIACLPAWLSQKAAKVSNVV